MASPPKTPRVLFYVQHLLGIGHLARASRVADALAADGFAVTMVSGGGRVEGFPGPGTKLVPLSPIRARDIEFSALVDDRGEPIGEALKERRRDMLLAALASVRPDVLIIEAFPFGRRQLRFELLPLLEAASAMSPRPLIAASLRDILQENRKAGRAEETVSLIERFFDLVMVHGDPRLATLDETFPLTAAIAGKIAYTGLVAPPRPPPATEHFDVVVSGGGGAAAGSLLDAAIAAANGLRPSLGRWCVVTGPNLAASTGPLPGHVELFSFRSDFSALLGSARLSISQAGYNTVCDILQARCRAVLIPFAGAGETEQTTRARRLAALGLAQVVSEAELTAETLGIAIGRALASPSPDHDLDLDGAPNTARLLRQRLAESFSQHRAVSC